MWRTGNIEGYECNTHTHTNTDVYIYINTCIYVFSCSLIDVYMHYVSIRHAYNV